MASKLRRIDVPGRRCLFELPSQNQLSPTNDTLTVHLPPSPFISSLTMLPDAAVAVPGKPRTHPLRPRLYSTITDGFFLPDSPKKIIKIPTFVSPGQRKKVNWSNIAVGGVMNMFEVRSLFPFIELGWETSSSPTKSPLPHGEIRDYPLTPFFFVFISFR